MRVLWFTNSPCNYQKNSGGYNGGGWMTALQCHIERQKNVELGICFVLDNQPDRVIQDGVVYYPVPFPKKSYKEKFLGYLKYSDISVDKYTWSSYIEHFNKVINNFNPDIIHIFGSELYMGLASFASKVPCVLHIQGTLIPYREVLFPPGMSKLDYILMNMNPLRIIQRYYWLVWWNRNCYRENYILRNVKHVIGRTDWDLRTSYVLNPDRVYHFGEEIMREPFYHPLKRSLPQKLIINTVISYPYYKGYDLILKTASCLKNSLNVDFEWNVYGNVIPEYFEKKLRVRHIDVNVYLKGVVSAETIREIHSNATVYIHSSYIENGCNAIIEAQMCGCTPIANYVGGLSTTIENGKTGFLVPANDPYQTAYLIKYLYEHPEENLEIGKNASKDAFERHNPEKIVSDLLQTYKEIIDVS